jgi:hypothetical protein
MGRAADPTLRTDEMTRPQRLGSGRARSVAASLAAPLGIVAGTLVILNGFVFRGLINSADTLQLWMPTYCYLGRALRAGHIPGWNPFLFGGAPFAADPQSGWLYAPAMVLFTALPCDVAIRLMVAFNPILAGLGLYWFLRSEGLPRPSASVGGLVISLGMSGAELVVSLPFAAALAWSAVLLACVSRYLRASRWSSHLVWGLLAALAWGQLAAAHFSAGLLMGTMALVAFLVAKIFGPARVRRLSIGKGLLLAAVLVVSLPLVNVAFLLPRLAYTSQTDLGLGYGKLAQLGAHLVGQRAPPFQPGPANSPSWALLLAVSPGAHLGAVALVLSFAGWWSKRYRHLVVAFTVVGVTAYLLSLKVVADAVPEWMRPWRPVDLYLHQPQWFSILVILCLAVLGAIGLTAWSETPDWNARLFMVVPGLALWFVLPLKFRAGPVHMSLFAFGLVACGAILVAGSRRAGWLALIPVILAVELVSNGVLSLDASSFVAGPDLIGRVPHPTLRASAYLRPGPIASAIAGSDGRYLRLGGLFAILDAGQVADNGLVLDHSMLYETQNAGGYNAVQLLRYWEFVRVTQHLDFKYNRALFTRPSPAASDLLQVDWIITQIHGGSVNGERLVAQQGAWGLYRRSVTVPRASVLGTWMVVQSADAARKLVADPAFDPSATVVLERDPGLGSPAPSGPLGGQVVYRPHGDQAASVETDVRRDSVLLVRTAYDRNWHATMDGHTVPLLPADYAMQAVPVPAGRHTIELTYDDPRIGYGLAGSAAVVGFLMAAFIVLRRKELRADPLPPPGPAAEREGS